MVDDGWCSVWCGECVGWGGVWCGCVGWCGMGVWGGVVWCVVQGREWLPWEWVVTKPQHLSGLHGWIKSGPFCGCSVQETKVKVNGIGVQG